MNINRRFALCLFLCGLLLIGDGRRHAFALAIPLAIGIATGAAVAVYNGINFYNSGAGEAILGVGVLMKNYVADFRGTMIDAVFTASNSDVVNFVNGSIDPQYSSLKPIDLPTVYPLNTNFTSSSSSIGNASVNGSSYRITRDATYAEHGCNTWRNDPGYYKFTANVTSMVLSRLCNSSPYGGYFRPFRYYENYLPSGSMESSDMPVYVANEVQNKALSKALDQLFLGGNQNHSEIPTNGITTSDGRTIRMDDLLDTEAFKLSKDALLAAQESQAAAVAASATSQAAVDLAEAQKQSADDLLAAGIIARDIALADAAADPTDLQKKAIADTSIKTVAELEAVKKEADSKLAAAKTTAATSGTAAAILAAQQAAAVAAAAKAALEETQANAVDMALPGASIYDTFIEPPEKKDIFALLFSFVSDSPLVNAIEGVVVVPSEPISKVTVNGLLPKLGLTDFVLVDFNKYHTLMASLGAIMVMIAQGFSVFVVVKGV